MGRSFLLALAVVAVPATAARDENSLEYAQVALDDASGLVTNFSSAVAARFEAAEVWCTSVRANKSEGTKYRAMQADSVRTALVQAKGAQGSLKAEIQHSTKELEEKTQSQKETTTIMQDEAAKLQAQRIKTNESLTLLDEMVAMLEERVAQDQAATAVESTSLLDVDPAVHRMLSTLDRSSSGTAGSYGTVLGMLKGMRDGLSNDLKKAEEDGAKKSTEYSTLLETVNKGIEDLERNYAKFSARMKEKETFLNDRDDIMKVVEAIETADGDQMLALADLCKAVEHKAASVAKAAKGATDQMTRVKDAMAELPAIRPQPNVSNVSTNDTLFLQLGAERHAHGHRHRHRHQRFLALNSERGLRLLGLWRSPFINKVTLDDSRLSRAAARVIKQEAVEVHSPALRRVATRVSTGSISQDQTLLSNLQKAMAKREMKLVNTNELAGGDESDEDWCKDNSLQILAMEREAQQKEDQLNIRIAELSGRNLSVSAREPIVSSAAGESNASLATKHKTFDPLETDLGKADAMAKDARTHVGRARAGVDEYLEDERAPAEANELPPGLDSVDAAINGVAKEADVALAALDKLSLALGKKLGKASQAYSKEAQALEEEQAAIDDEATGLQKEKAQLKPLHKEIEHMKAEQEKDCAAALLAKSKRVERIRLEENAVGVALRLLTEQHK